jgi:hypothetical protein
VTSLEYHRARAQERPDSLFEQAMHGWNGEPAMTDRWKVVPWLAVSMPVLTLTVLALATLGGAA